MKNARKIPKKNLERMTKAELLEALRSVQAEIGDPALLADESRRTLRELEAHQIELEAQNRELMEAHQLLAESRNRYAALYDFAPVGFVTLDHWGAIQEMNLTGAAMLGIERSWLVGKPFVSFVAKQDRRRFRRHFQQCQISEGQVTADIGLVARGNGAVRVEMSSASVRGPNGGGWRSARRSPTSRSANTPKTP